MSAKPDMNKLDVCPECGGEIKLNHERGEHTCSRCGLVIDDMCIDYSRDDKRAYTKKEKEQRERIGPPISRLLHDMSLTTTIDMKNVTNSNQIRIFREDRRIPWEKRNLLQAKTELQRISSILNLPSHIRESAMKHYRKALKMKLLRGRSINGMVVACLYICCREANVPRTWSEFIDETAQHEKVIKSCYKALIKELNIKSPITDPRILIPRWVAELELTSEIESKTIEILNIYLKRFHTNTSGKDPKGYCAGALYLVAKAKNRKVPQKIIAKLVGVTEVTLRSRYKDLIKKLNIQMPE